MPRKGIGSGLEALFGTDVSFDEDSDLRLLPISKIEPNSNQPRENFDGDKLDALADSIAEHGIIQPIAVRRVDAEHYQIIAGERRWRAARKAGLEEVPARILDADDRTTMVLALVENLQREDLNPVEQARGLKKLMEDYGFTQETAAQRVGWSRPAVANALRLLALPEDVLAKLEEGTLSAGHARSLLPLGDADLIGQTAEQVIQEELSVRQTEALVRRLLAPKPEKTEVPSADHIYVKALEERLTRHMGHKVRILPGAKKSRLEIEYYGNEDLDQLLVLLGAAEQDRDSE